MALIWPIEQIDSTGQDVRTVQYLLTAHGQNLTVDGIFGPLTRAGVKAFQSSHGLSADGVVGPLTWPALVVPVASGSSGPAVKAVQSQVDSRINELVVDGNFGPETETTVKQFQTILGLTVDGIVGPVTWNAYVEGYLPGTNPELPAMAVFQAWSQHNEAAARKNGSPSAVSSLFTRTWSPSDGWAFAGSNGAAGTVYYTWKRTSGPDMALGVSDGPEGYFFVAQVDWNAPVP